MSPAARASEPLFPRRRLILFTACLGAFMATLDTSIVYIALPQIAREFQVSLERISWVVTVYLLINASLLLTGGRLADLWSPGRVYLLGMLTFTGASVLCGLSSGLAWMIGGRALQGLGASLMLGVAPKLIALTYGEGERGLALGLFSTAFATGISVGAPLGGLITAYLGWPYIFFINIPICSLALLVGSRPLRALAAPASWDRRLFDLWGGICLAGGLASLMLALERLRHAGWQDGLTLGSVGLATGCFVGLAFLERRQAVPLLHRDLWGRRPFLLGSVTVVLTFGGVMGTFFLAPFFLEQVYGYSPKQTGLMLAALSATNALVSPLGGYLADRLGNMLILRTGSLLVLLGLGSLWFTAADNSTFSLTLRLAFLGLGFGLFQAPNLNEVLRGVAPGLIGLAAGTNAVLKNLGSLLGITLMVTVVAWINSSQVSQGGGVGLGLGSFQGAVEAAVLVAAVNLLVNLLPRKTVPLGEP
jgi:EmrB/QacA subfamily drug resistance transporter